jgi:hypothetical protein
MILQSKQDQTTTRHLSRHLDHDQLCDFLLATEGAAQDAAHGARQQHLDNCLICASELDLLRTSVTGFRAASIAVANRALARRPLEAPISARNGSRSSRYISPTFFWAATALLFAAVLPLGLYHQNLNPFLKPHLVAPVSTASTAPTHTLESDEALLEAINQDLSAAIPSPMQPLAGPAASTASTQPDSTQRKN